MIVKETKDIEEIKAVLCHPEIYDCISDDTCPHSDDFEPPLESNEYIAGYHKDEIFAVMVYHYKGDKYYTHIQVLPSHRKERAIDFARMALAFGLSKNVPIYAEIPDIYPNVLKFAKSFGFKVVDIKENQHLKNDELGNVSVLRCDNGIC